MTEYKFPYTQEGYKQAVEYLKKIGEWVAVSSKGFSNDGWSVIYEANSIYEKRNKNLITNQ